MSVLRSTIGLALIVVSALASAAFAAHPSANSAGPSAASAAEPDNTRWDDRFALELSRRFADLYPAQLQTTAVYQGELYVAGSFEEDNYWIDALRNIARWNGRQWNSVGVNNWLSYDISSARITDLAVHEGKLYATGRFAVAGVAANIASWDGQQWQALGQGLNDSGYALASYGGDLYVAGTFSLAGGTAAKGVARWDGTQWHAVGAGLESSSGSSPGVSSLLATPQGLYAGGEFYRSDNYQRLSLALWDGSQWSAAIPELRGRVTALDWHEGALYAAGPLSFETAVPVSGSLLRWDGTQAQLLTAGLGSGTVARMVRSAGDELYASAMEKLYRWNGAAWEPFGRSLAAGEISDIIAYDNTLHLVGGIACQPADCTAKDVLAWTGDRWNGLGEGVVSPGVGSIAVAGDAFYVASEIVWDEQILGSQRSRNLGRWDASGWHDATLGLNSPVTSLVAAGGSLYAARAAYSPSGGYDTATVVRLDGDVQTSLPGVFKGVVNTLAYVDGSLYAGGTFSQVGAVQARAVARWNGTSWAALGDPQLSEVKALAVHGGAVYVAGTPIPYQGYSVVARWDGAAWAVLGTTSGSVKDIAVAPDGALYVAGLFGLINDVQATIVARWRDGGWEALPHDFRPTESVGPYSAGANALAIGADGAVYLGGLFASAGTPGMKSIARYDGGWHALGSGVDGVVLDLEVSGSDIYVGGLLSRAGGKSSSNVAIWHGGSPSTIFLPLVMQ